MQHCTLTQSIRRDQQSSVRTVLQDLVRENTRNDINLTKQLDELAGEIKGISMSQSNTLASTGSGIAIEQRILDSLRFQSMNVRHSNIAEAHAKTFSWIFETSKAQATDPRPQVKFVEWLQQPSSRNGIYWIGGKAGSGKSTLMKFLCDHIQTKKALRVWAEPEKLVTASYFFWNDGTSMQKSQEGLLQSLLYEVLKACPDLVRAICPTRWESANLKDPWTRSELLQTFKRLTEQDVTSTKFCFFIDGLDEYEGNDHQGMVDNLRDFAMSPNIKLCLSSRPWEVFKDAFDQDTDQRLYLQDLTGEDIKLYVRGKLEESPYFIRALKGASQYQHLVVEIVDRAQGVFLWVYLVVRSLLNGLTNADSMKELQTRLRRLPTDLESFFKHMLDSVDSIYHSQAARTFQVALTATEPLPLLLYSYLDDLEDYPTFAVKTKSRTRKEFIPNVLRTGSTTD